MFYVVPNYEFAEVNELGQIRSSFKAGKTFKHLKVTFNDQSSDVASSEAKR